ncbi:MAG: LacI family DNA-binding transcriptional regulator, partial [Devosia sp.]|nr:LacI family DNA-binding transcriptional regulator [Devosia sp.]
QNSNKPTGAVRPVRVEDVAREAGVSPITVSRALSSPAKVRAETRQRVTDAVARTGYVVNSIASTLRSGRSSIVTAFVASLQNPHFASAMQGTIDAFEGSRYHLMFAQTGYSEELRADVVESVLPFRPAGILFTGVVRNEDTRIALKRLGVPVVEMWGDRPDPIDMLVGSSAFEGGRLMGEHFGRQGFRRVAYCGHTLDRGAERLTGFRSGLAPFGLRPELVLPYEGTRTFGEGMGAVDQIVAALPGCDAIFFGTDLLAVGALLRARQRGIDIPGQLAVAGYGDLEFAEHIDPALTSIRVSDYQMGRDAGAMLLKRLMGQRIEQPIVLLPVQLMARVSTLRHAGVRE